MGMVEIRKESGEVISRSRNLRGLRAYAGKHWTEQVHINKKPDGGGTLTVRFAGGVYCVTPFASFVVLCESLVNWRNLYGATLFVNDVESGEVGYKNAALRAHARFGRVG